jgi:hypothetical protein
MDAGVAAPKGGLHVRLYSMRLGGGGGLAFLSFGWQGARLWETLELASLRQGLFPHRVPKAKFRDSGRSKLSCAFKGFFWGKPSISTPMMTVLTGVATLLRAPFWLPFDALGLRLKTLDLAVSTMAAHASLPSWGCHRGALILLGLVMVALVASLGSSCTFLDYL